MSAFLDPRVLARIDNLELLARTVVSGFINGLHRAPYLGLSMDFAEHRAYMPGDDLRRVDWKLYARSDRYYVKEFEADTNANLLLLLDVSRSMAYRGAGIPKLDYARYLVAALAYFGRTQRDRVGLATFDDDVVDYIPPSAKHLELVLHTLARIKPREGVQGRLGPALLRVASGLNRRGIVVLVSDLYEEPAAVLEAVRPLLGRRQDLIVFHLLDPNERDFPFDEATSLEELETGERIPVVPRGVRERYRELMAMHLQTLSRELGENRVDYALLDTGTPLDHALFTFLASRERLNRGR